MELDLELIKTDLAVGRTHDAAAYQRTVRQLIAEVERLQARLQALEQMLDKLAQFRPGEISARPDEGLVEPRSEWPGE